MNRDESRARHEAGIKAREASKVNLLFPVDGLAGGTWFGINDSGVVMALLNRYQAQHVRNPITRGKIIPNCLSRGSYNNIFEHLNNQSFFLLMTNDFFMLYVAFFTFLIS